MYPRVFFPFGVFDLVGDRDGSWQSPVLGTFVHVICVPVVIKNNFSSVCASEEFVVWRQRCHCLSFSRLFVRGACIGRVRDYFLPALCNRSVELNGVIYAVTWATISLSS